MPDATTTVHELKEAVRAFAEERAWQPFHSPKNLVMGLAVETAELMEHFLWVGADESRRTAQDPARRAALAEELADVAVYVLNLSLSMDIDLSEAIRSKLVKNALKYPVEKYRGKYEAND